MARSIPGIALILLLAACSTAGVDMNEPRRVVGTENSVRIDAQITGESVRPGARIPVTYTITNERPGPIAVADLVEETSWDEELRTFTVTIGSEVPGNQLLPRLIEIAPGEQKTFTGVARLNFVPQPSVDPRKTAQPAAFRLKLNFLGETEPFRELIGLKENAIANPRLADELFPLWLERNEVVYTNSVPMRWETRPMGTSPAELRGRRRGGR